MHDSLAFLINSKAICQFCAFSAMNCNNRRNSAPTTMLYMLEHAPHAAVCCHVMVAVGCLPIAPSRPTLWWSISCRTLHCTPHKGHLWSGSATTGDLLHMWCTAAVQLPMAFKSHPTAQMCSKTAYSLQTWILCRLPGHHCSMIATKHDA